MRVSVSGGESGPVGRLNSMSFLRPVWVSLIFREQNRGTTWRCRQPVTVHPTPRAVAREDCKAVLDPSQHRPARPQWSRLRHCAAACRSVVRCGGPRDGGVEAAPGLTSACGIFCAGVPDVDIASREPAHAAVGNRTV